MVKQALPVALVAFLAIAGAEVLAQANEADRSEGIWKSVTPQTNMKGEFGNHDPVGLAAGVAIKTDCSINWIDPDSHRRYCFNSATSLVYFERWPKRNIARARENWNAMQPMQ